MAEELAGNGLGAGGREPCILFFDVDGTLVWDDPSRQVAESIARAEPSPAVHEAFRQLAAAGHRTFICTGRPYGLVPRSLVELGPTGLVTGAGSSVVVHGRVVFESSIPRDLIIEVAKRALRLGVGLFFESSDICVGLTPADAEYAGIPGMPVAHSVEELERMAPRLAFDKFSYQITDRPILDREGDFFKAHFTDSDVGVGVGEMGLLGVDKGTGVRHALEALDLPGAKTYAFGDSENDLPMLKAVDVPVAMGNALPVVKEAATYVTDSVQRDGVVMALRRFGLI